MPIASIVAERKANVKLRFRAALAFTAGTERLGGVTSDTPGLILLLAGTIMMLLTSRTDAHHLLLHPRVDDPRTKAVQ